MWNYLIKHEGVEFRHTEYDLWYYLHGFDDSSRPNADKLGLDISNYLNGVSTAEWIEKKWGYEKISPTTLRVLKFYYISIQHPVGFDRDDFYIDGSLMLNIFDDTPALKFEYEGPGSS